MPPLTYIHTSEAARTTAGGRGVGGGIFTPPLQAVNGLILIVSAQGSPESTRHVCVPLAAASGIYRFCPPSRSPKGRRSADVPFRAFIFSLK